MLAHSVIRYDYAKHRLLHSQIPMLGYQFRDNLVLHTVSSAFAGFVATSECRLVSGSFVT
jgi:dicarboxylate transporter 10